MPDSHTFTTAEKLAEIKKEIGFRYGVYTKQVQAGRMTQAEMDRKIALMNAIREDYQRQVDDIKAAVVEHFNEFFVQEDKK